MFCECGTYLPDNSNCKICGNNPIKKSIISEKFYSIHQKYKNEDKGAKIAETCPKCGSEEMYYKAVQLRSADEGQTIFYTCDCGYKFATHS
ncbi:RNA polymerase I transcription factor TFIIS, subunit A12.2/RPA12 [Pseudoloma neurophilia]|uniref:DNA-directed RNA polymerase I subunit RPA12 n=1 Tax=Pseudoloma neurophilia TaxID=146866 RepID=A0A0R0M121_9MICR|nr:RNA polymerase I transcription factor TFIIS, subunit A12.2/RPA12 [Pseudoloma neurophilia]